MRSNPIPLIAALLLLSLSLPAQSDQRYSLFLNSGAIIPAKNISVEKVDQYNRSAAKADGKSYAIIQFENIPTPAERKQLAEAGIELLEYIPNNAYTVTISKSINTLLLTQLKARAIVELSAEQKMQPELAKGNIPAWAVKISGTVDVWISFPKSFTYETVSTEIKKRNFDILVDEYIGYRIIGLRIAASRLNELAGLPFVEYVQPAPHQDQALNTNSMALSKANVLRGPLLAGGRNLKGEGVVVGVGDGGDVQSHIDVSGSRLINRSFLPFDGHATHVTGTIAGAGLVQESYTGYAPKATIVSQSFSNIIAYSPTYVQDYGMVVANNSYGSIVQDCNYSGVYDLTSRILDQMAFDLPELQHVFAAGNDGVFTCGAYPLGFKTVLGGYQSAKNVLTVGSTFFRGDITINSSKGPVKDGRIKPEITAQGQSVRSLWLNNSFSSFSGTSMSSPGVSGGLVLLEQRYRQLNSGANANNGLLKALICNGGTDAGNEGPDFRHGFGNMNLLRSVTMMENNTYFIDSVANAANKIHNITIPANTAHLKVTLYWQDPPASLLAAKTLVNDLDLEVTTPSSGIVLPRILDTLPANVNLIAGTGADHMNNIEQVTIDNPATGNYSFKITGTAITVNPLQKYYLVYDVIPESLTLTNPVGGEIFVPTTAIVEIDSTHIEWESYGGTPSQFTVEFSPDNGTTWSLASPTSNVLNSDSRYFNWGVPDIQTNQARIRVTKNGTGASQTSLPFTIIRQAIDSLTPNQCEGYINLGWRPTPGATDYEVMILRDGEMVPVATTTALNYTFAGLSKDTLYWVTVRARINGSPGRRALAVSRQPNNGTCIGTISDFDLKIDSILSPSSGRKFTSSELVTTVPITIRIKNLDDVASTDDIVVTYSINGGGTVTETINTSSTPTSTIAAGGFIDYTFFTPANLAAVGTYNLEVTATKATDVVLANNGLVKTIKQLANQPITAIDFPWLDNLESTSSQSVVNKQMGLNGSDRYDFVNSTIYGRLRTFINSGIAYSGNRAITLDATQYFTSGSNTDSLTGTFNLGTFNAATDDIRLDFQYKNHGQQSSPANKVWIRGSDADNWIEAYDLYSNQNDVDATFKQTGSIELSDLLRSSAPLQNFSSSFQIRWGQNGGGQATDNFGLYGYTFDDIKLYQVSNDIQMISIDTPVVASCSLTASNLVRVTVRNSANTTINNIPVRFRVDGGAWLNPAEIISSIPGNDTVQYTFTATANLATAGQHLIEALVDFGADSYRLNDTVRLSIYNAPVITVTSTTPHLENFETGDGAWHSTGKNNSWEYGTPNSVRIKRAASGSKAWKTSLTGNYNDGEKSYLYSPCYDVSSLTAPTLSFSLALDIEDCGSGLCDGAYMEYSVDGKIWDTLGNVGQGTNWYNKDFSSGVELWGVQNYTRWHVATIPLTSIPVPVAQLTQLRLRLVMVSDMGVNRDGIAIDDIHIYDNTNGIYNVTGTSPVVNQPSVTGSSWIHFVDPGTNKLIASVNPNGQNLGSTNVQSYVNTGGVRIKNQQFYHDRNITIKPTNVNLADSATVRFYFLDSETEALINATGCASCYKPTMVQDLGVSKYSNTDDNVENGTLADDNASGNWLFINATKAVKVPFDKGYYTEFKVKDFSEFWLNNGGFDNNQTLPVELTSFTAKKMTNGKDVLLEWKTASEFNVSRFELQVAKGNTAYAQNQFVKITEVNSKGNSVQEQQYNYNDLENGKSGVRYYRLKIIDNDGSFKYSAIRSVIFTDEIKWQVNPNPSSGLFNLTYQANEGTAIAVKLFDVTGKTIKESKTLATGFEQKINLDLTAPKYASGLYLLEITAGDKKQSFRLLKQ